jgi:acetyltransferase-like isoleucine patch superfamily enzyme
MRSKYKPEGPTVEDSVTIGANATILPGVHIGEGAFIAAGAVVLRDVPPWTLVKGNPGQICKLPEKLRERNHALRW